MILKWSEGDYILDRICGEGCPCRFKEDYTHLNMKRNDTKPEENTLSHGGVTPPSVIPETRWINVRGREEHEAIIRDAALCKELGLDQMYEVLVYFKRWGGWLGE